MPKSDRENLEEKLGHLSKTAQRYSQYDPKWVALHKQIDETLDLWRVEVAMGDPPDVLV
jgi:hypothetical protein